MATWDLSLKKQLRTGVGPFTLEVGFRSAAQRLVLYGPSGAGKTQTLRMIAGITPPDSGWVRVAGRTLFDAAAGLNLSPQQRQVGYVFQDYALFPHLTVRQNIAFALRQGWRNPLRREPLPEADRWIEQFGLQEVAAQLPHQISDEPFAALDKALRHRLREELLELQASLQLPLLLITHDEDDVDRLAQEVVQLDAGRVRGSFTVPSPWPQEP